MMCHHVVTCIHATWCECVHICACVCACVHLRVISGLSIILGYMLTHYIQSIYIPVDLRLFFSCKNIIFSFYAQVMWRNEKCPILVFKLSLDLHLSKRLRGNISLGDDLFQNDLILAVHLRSYNN